MAFVRTVRAPMRVPVSVASRSGAGALAASSGVMAARGAADVAGAPAASVGPVVDVGVDGCDGSRDAESARVVRGVEAEPAATDDARVTSGDAEHAARSSSTTQTAKAADL